MSRRLVLPLLLLLPFVFSGCLGGKEKFAAYTNAESEGQYIFAGGLKYQVQLSRELNPGLPEDSAYLKDLGAGIVPPAAGHEWFAVFMRVENDSKMPHRMASDFDITDTLGNTYTSIPVAPTNLLSYQPQLLQPKDIYPYSQTSIAQSGPRRGSVILFQIATTAYQNRPLTMRIHAPGGDVASVSIDL